MINCLLKRRPSFRPLRPPRRQDREEGRNGDPLSEKREETFRVVDRRLFTSEGELRKEVLEEKEREQTPPSEKVGPAKKQAPPPATAAASGTPIKPPEAPEPARNRNFDLLVDLIARNAVAYMGGVTDPRTGQPMLDLEGAREVIDMLDALLEKTRGNLASEEEQMLLDVLGSLKMSYLELSKAAASAMREKATGKT